MAAPRALIVTGEGINCDYETTEAFELALREAGGFAESVHLSDLVEGHKRLADYQILALPGGFSFGDDIASGKVFTVRMKAKLDDDIRRFVEDENLVIGVCNGAQIGIKYPIPGLDVDGEQEATLTYNNSGRFQDEWITLKTVSQNCVWTRGLSGLELPIAHGEGKFYVADRRVLEKLYEQGQIALKYEGYNPNGSMDDVAGICDPTGRILILMPHPERYVHPWQHPQWTRQKVEGRLPKEGHGLQIFRNGVDYFR